MTRDAALAILSSPDLSYESCTRDCLETWARCRDMESTVRRGSFCDDFVLSWLAHRARIPLVESSEIRSRWRRFVPNTTVRYAITHPHKLASTKPA
jgi:hypothetical protein